MRKRLVAGNWKSNGSEASCRALAKALGSVGVGDEVDVVVCPPFVYLSVVGQLIEGSGVCLGAQNVSAHGLGAFTGEVSVEMLRDVGCEFVIVGHSERRALLAETDGQLTTKLRRAIAGGLQPIFCVGETLEQREAGVAQSVVWEQLDRVLPGLDDHAAAVLIVAYEPVWAIGTGLTASAEQVQQVHAWIRVRLQTIFPGKGEGIRILYGGSVTPANAAFLFACPDVDGALVGGASLKAEDFLAICRCAASVQR